MKQSIPLSTRHKLARVTGGSRDQTILIVTPEMELGSYHNIVSDAI